MKNKSLISKVFAVFLLISIWFALHGPSSVRADVCTLTGTSWSNPGLWSCGRVPIDGDDVVIASAGSVLNTSSANLNSLTINNSASLNIGNNNSQRTLTVLGDVTVNSGGQIAPGTASIPVAHNFFISGNLVNNGTFNGTGSPASFNVAFNGSGLQTISGSNVARFSNLTVANGSTVLVPVNAQSTVDGILTNNGTLQQIQTVDNQNVSFFHILDNAGTTTKYRGVEVNTSNNLGDVTASVRSVDISNGEYCTTTGVGSPAYVKRCYTISAQNPNNPATVTLWVLDGERNGIGATNLTPYHFESATWQPLSSITRGSSGSYYYAAGTTSGFSEFLLGDVAQAPTAVSLQSFTADNPANGLIVLGGAAALILLAGLIVLRRRPSKA